MGLGEQDFKVATGAKGTAIASLARASAEPLTVGLMLQWSGMRVKELPYDELGPAAGFLRAVLARGDAGFAVLYSDPQWARRQMVQLGYASAVTDNAAALGQFLARARRLEYWGSSALYDWMIEESRVERRAGKQGCRALVIVADGHDNASKHSVSRAVQACLRSRSVVYFVSLVDADPFDRQGLKSVASHFAKRTGGMTFFIHKKPDFARAFGLIARDL